MSGNFPDCLESFWNVWKVSGQSGKFPDCLKSFRTVRKFSGESGKFPDCPESFRIVWKGSGLSEKFPDSPEIFQRVWKVSRLSGKFLDSLESFPSNIWISWLIIQYTIQSVNILHCLNVNIMAKNPFSVLCAYDNMSRKQFTRFW